MSFFVVLAIYYSLVCWVAAIFLRTDGMIHSNAEVVFAPVVFCYVSMKFVLETVLRRYSKNNFGFKSGL